MVDPLNHKSGHMSYSICMCVLQCITVGDQVYFGAKFFILIAYSSVIGFSSFLTLRTDCPHLSLTRHIFNGVGPPIVVINESNGLKCTQLRPIFCIFFAAIRTNCVSIVVIFEVNLSTVLAMLTSIQ